MNIELKNGERIITTVAGQPTNVDDEKAVMENLIRENLGYEAYQEFRDLYGYEDEGENWELIADEYYGMLNDTLNELDAILNMFDGRMNKEKVYKALKAVRDNIYNNA